MIVIGRDDGAAKSTVGDYYILYRIDMLIDQKLLEESGNLAGMTTFKIRKKL